MHTLSANQLLHQGRNRKARRACARKQEQAPQNASARLQPPVEEMCLANDSLVGIAGLVLTVIGAALRVYVVTMAGTTSPATAMPAAAAVVLLVVGLALSLKGITCGDLTGWMGLAVACLIGRTYFWMVTGQEAPLPVFP